MAIQILRDPGVAALLGEKVGTGLGSGLSALAQMKMQDIQRQRSAQRAAPGLQALGFEPTQAQAISLLDPALQKEALRQMLQAPSQQAYASALSSLFGSPQAGAEPQGAAPAPPGVGEVPGIPSGAPGMPPLGALKPEQATRLAQLGLQKQQMGEKRELAQRKETRPYREKVLDAEKGAKEVKITLDTMKNLGRGGKLDHPMFSNLMNKMDLGWMLEPESQEFKKLSSDLFRRIVTTSKGRVTNIMAEQFVNSLPTLAQTPEGREKVIKNLNLMNEIELAYPKTMREILKENRGVPPFDLQEQVSERVDDRIGKLTQKLILPEESSEATGLTIKDVEPTPAVKAQPIIDSPAGGPPPELPRIQSTIKKAISPLLPLKPTTRLESLGHGASEVARHGVRSLSRAAEAVAGLPGDIAQGVSSLLNLGKYALTGQNSPILQNLPYVPTSSKIKNYITEPIVETLAGKGYLDPSGRGEAFADDVAGDLATFLLPIKGKIPFKKALITAGAGNLAKYAAQSVKVPELGQEGIKLGTMLAVNFAGPRKFANMAEKLYGDARSALPKGAEVASRPIRPVFEELSSLLSKGDLPSDWTKKLAHYTDQIAGGKIPVQDIWDLSKDINNVFFGKKAPAAFTRAFPELKQGIENTLKEYGKTNPKFFNSLTDANSIYSSLAKQKSVSESLRKYIPIGKYGVGTTGALLGWYSPAKLALAAGGALGAKGISHIYKTYNTMAKSPAAQKYFFKTVGAAVKNNARQVSHFATKLDKELQK